MPGKSRCVTICVRLTLKLAKCSMRTALAQCSRLWPRRSWIARRECWQRSFPLQPSRQYRAYLSDHSWQLGSTSTLCCAAMTRRTATFRNTRASTNACSSPRAGVPPTTIRPRLSTCARFLDQLRLFATSCRRSGNESLTLSEPPASGRGSGCLLGTGLRSSGTTQARRKLYGQSKRRRGSNGWESGTESGRMGGESKVHTPIIVKTCGKHRVRCRGSIPSAQTFAGRCKPSRTLGTCPRLEKRLWPLGTRSNEDDYSFLCGSTRFRED